jgi:hypothetical protein
MIQGMTDADYTRIMDEAKPYSMAPGVQKTEE